jgi:diketogulonate reductase-like aldo/keto reductase
MEALVNMGLAKAIGLSNFNEQQIIEIVTDGTIKPAMLQVEIHPFNQEHELSRFCAEHKIALTAYSPLGSGNAIDGMTVLENPVLADIGKHHDKSSAQVVLAWLLQRGIIVIPKSVTAARITSNIEVAFELSAEEMSAVGSLDKRFRNGWGGPQVERDGEMQPRDLEHPLYVSPLLWAGTVRSVF